MPVRVVEPPRLFELRAGRILDAEAIHVTQSDKFYSCQMTVTVIQVSIDFVRVHRNEESEGHIG